MTLTRIVRGTDPAPADRINTTTRGPWVVNVLTIDPRRARGRLLATCGPDLARVEPTTRLVRDADALAGVNGRYRLTTGGDIVVPAGTGSFFDRNPRTIAGTTDDGRVVLATVDGRRVTSVGTTMDETATGARALGLRDSLNLDGGGSTTMSVRGELVNTPSGSVERAVGDALVLVPH